MQIVKTFVGNFPQRDITDELNNHPDWSVQTMTSFVYHDVLGSSHEVITTVVVFNMKDNTDTVSNFSEIFGFRKPISNNEYGEQAQ